MEGKIYDRLMGFVRVFSFIRRYYAIRIMEKYLVVMWPIFFTKVFFQFTPSDDLKSVFI